MADQSHLMSQSSRDLMKAIQEDKAKQEATRADSVESAETTAMNKTPLLVGCVLFIGVVIGLAFI